MTKIRIILAGLLAALVLLLPSQSLAFGPYDNVEILEVKDGDTFSVRVEVWPEVFIVTDVRVRHIDTPETRRGTKNKKKIPECEIALGKKAKAYAKQKLKGHVTIPQVFPKTTKYYGRMSADVMVDGELFYLLMVEAGHAVLYSGGTRDIWPCSDD